MKAEVEVSSAVALVDTTVIDQCLSCDLVDNLTLMLTDR
jgi:hypothetical protein